MRFRTQSAALAQMELETRRALRRLEEQRLKPILAGWAAVQQQLKGAILTEHQAAFGNGPMNLPLARRRGVLLRTERRLRGTLATYHELATTHIRETLAEVKKQETLRALWMLDQVTPPHLNVRAPAVFAREAADPDPTDLTWADRMNVWFDTYATSLTSGLTMHAMQGSDALDAAADVDGTKVQVPGAGRFDMGSLLERLYRTQVIGAEADARDEVADANKDVVLDEIWQTLEDERVCDECDPNDGLSRDEADGEIPLHPNCRCFYRIVPKAWADLLRSGDEADRALALQYDDLGLVSDSMAIPGPNGGAGAFLKVSFDDWAEQMGPVIGVGTR